MLPRAQTVNPTKETDNVRRDHGGFEDNKDPLAANTPVNASEIREKDTGVIGEAGTVRNGRGFEWENVGRALDTPRGTSLKAVRNAMEMILQSQLHSSVSGRRALAGLIILLFGVGLRVFRNEMVLFAEKSVEI